MEAQANERGLSFRYDAAVFPCLPGGSNEPVDLRVAPEKVVEHDLSSPERQRQWIDKMEQTDALPMNNRLYPCGAGATGFYSDPFGNLSPCLMTTHYRVEPDDRSFQEVWTQQLGMIQKKQRSGKASCLSGEMRGACVHCAAMNRLETGDEEIESDYFIKTSALRYRAVMDLKSKKGNEHE
jgi:MoaA/NifB/PqqE/SkfB family radical SAM enzyme